MKINNFLFWVLVGIGMLSFQSCLSDLRPKEFRTDERFTAASHEKAVSLLNTYAERSGLSKWKTVKTYQVDYADNFYGTFGKLANPFKDKKNNFKLRYVPMKSKGNLRFSSGSEKGMVWGYDEGTTYTKTDRNAQAEIKKSKKITFWLPTYQYFIEFPFRITNADVIYHVGERKYGLQVYDLILVSWKTHKPQKNLDQYLIWINQSTGLVDKLQYTIRDQAGILKGTAIIDEYQDYNGIKLPSLFKVYSKEDSTKPVHIMRLYNFRANTFDPQTLTVTGGS